MLNWWEGIEKKLLARHLTYIASFQYILKSNYCNYLSTIDIFLSRRKIAISSQIIMW